MQRMNLSQKQLQKLSPQQIQLMKLLQVTTANLDQRIEEELQTNPALEKGEEEDKEDNEFDDLEQDKEENIKAAEDIGLRTIPAISPRQVIRRIFEIVSTRHRL